MGRGPGICPSVRGREPVPERKVCCNEIPCNRRRRAPILTFVMARKSVSAVGTEIHQTKAFATLEEELLVALLRTTDVLEERFERALEPFRISMTQYNVLRILRGAEPKGRSCGEIGERMIAREPDVTRLLERMEKAGLLRRTRSSTDRRVVMARITPRGLKLLQGVAPRLRKVGGLLKPVGGRRIEKTLRVLDEVRASLRGLE
jgi:DNA-binding MarR family transcriptional regulator